MWNLSTGTPPWDCCCDRRGPRPLHRARAEGFRRPDRQALARPGHGAPRWATRGPPSATDLPAAGLRGRALPAALGRRVPAGPCSPTTPRSGPPASRTRPVTGIRPGRSFPAGLNSRLQSPISARHASSRSGKDAPGVLRTGCPSRHDRLRPAFHGHHRHRAEAGSARGHLTKKPNLGARHSNVCGATIKVSTGTGSHILGEVLSFSWSSPPCLGLPPVVYWPSQGQGRRQGPVLVEGSRAEAHEPAAPGFWRPNPPSSFATRWRAPSTSWSPRES